MDETLLERMLPYIGNCAATIASGRMAGLCEAAHNARLDGVLGHSEYDKILKRINYYVNQHICGFVCVHLTRRPPFAWRDDPDTRVLAAERWREWAITLVRDAQRELYGHG